MFLVYIYIYVHLAIAFSISSRSQTMAAQKFISLIILAIFHTSALKCIAFPHPSRGIKAAYWPSFDAFPASAIDTSYFTHIYYAFLLPDPITYKLNVTPFDQTKIPDFMGAIRLKNPPVKTLLSTGGGGNDPTVFSKMVSSRATRQTFIDSTIEVARKYGFDGVDLDWEFPANAEDMSNLALLYKQWRAALLDEARTFRKPLLLLTSAVYYASKITLLGEPRSYPVEALRRYVDWISPMCFDYHGSWENFTGAHSALRDHVNSNLSTHFGIGSWIQAGVPAGKLVMGLPLYGRTWKLQEPYVNGIGAPALGVGPGDGGVLDYHQILDFNDENNATVVFDGQTVSYYSFAGDSWIGYDDVQSVRLKIQFARSRQLGGYFFWALGQDKNWTISALGKLSIPIRTGPLLIYVNLMD
jgi:chitinase